jgi:hypothetical protein
VLAVLAFMLSALVFSDASFTARSANPADVFVAGDLSHVNDKSGQVMILASGLDPGGSRVGTMTLTGTGNVPGAFTLSASSLVNTPAASALSDALTLTVEDITGTATTLYDGAVSDFSDVDLGTIAPGAARSYRLTLEYPDGPIDAGLQGATMTLSLLITGVAP